MYYKCVKFHKNPISGLGGVALTRYKDGRTDRVISMWGGIIRVISLCTEKQFFLEAYNHKHEFPVAAMFVNGSARNEQSL